MALATIDPGIARLARTMPCWVRRQIIGPQCSPELYKYGMFPWEGQFRDTPPSESPRWTTDTPPPTPPPVPVVTSFGVQVSIPSGGSALILGTQYIGPAALMQISGFLSVVEFKPPYAFTLKGISVTMVNALAAGHTCSFQFTVGGVDSSAILLSLAAGQIDGVALGSIPVGLGTAVAIKHVQVGSGGDTLQSLTVLYGA